MSPIIVLVDHLKDFTWDAAGLTVLRTRDYIAGAETVAGRSPRVINLSRTYRCLDYGYYASLLAEVRNHRVIPSAQTILELNQRGSWLVPIQELMLTLQRTMAQVRDTPEKAFSVLVCFGRTDDRRFGALARKAFDLFRCPVLRIRIGFEAGRWTVKGVVPVNPASLKGEAHALFGTALAAHTRLGWRTPKKRKHPRYTLAMLHNPHEALPPSDPEALARFQAAGEELGMEVEPIQKRDFSKLAEYDGLFIRETTAIDDHTYRFAVKAAQEGMPVIDDPDSILRCSNKVYLAERLHRKKVPTPKTLVLDRKRVKTVADQMAFPLVLKVPDGSFSRGMHKVATPGELKARARELFEDSDIILAQEFMYTDYDWRVGVLAGQPLFVCQYQMAKNHWQIYHHIENGDVESGDFATFAVEDAPRPVIETALKAAALMGDGLYGVDLKQNDRGVFVVEVNDNPNVDSDIEDKVLGMELYRRIMQTFVQRLEKARA